MSNLSLLASIEALLFVSGEPLSSERLTKVLKRSEDEVTAALNGLAERYAANSDSGLTIIRHNGEFVLATKGEAASLVEALTMSTMQENLSRAALEVLSIIAYRAPITRAEVESIRGVNCSFTIRNLLLRNLIEREGNPSDGRGYLYRPSVKFLQHLGLGSERDLPDYAVLAADDRLTSLFSDPERPGDDARL